MGANSFSPVEIDAIGEILNISLGASATAASTMLDARVDITTPVVRVENRDEFSFTNLEPAVGVEITYVDGLTGNNVMLLKRQDVKAIVEMLMGMEIADEDFELNEMNISAICEVMNQMMGASATALSELLGRPVNISTPRSYEITSDEQFKDKYFTEGNYFMVVISFHLSIAGKLKSEFMNLMPIVLAKELVSGFFPGGFGEEEEPQEAVLEVIPEAVLEAVPEAAPPQAEASQSGRLSQDEASALVEALLASAAGTDSAEEAPAPAAQVQVQAPAAQTPAGEAPAAQAPAAQPQAGLQPPVNVQPSVDTPAPAAVPAGTPMAAPAAAVQAPVMQADTIALTKELMELQKMQMQMMEQMRQMEAERKERKPKQIRVHSSVQPSLREGDAAEADPDSNLDLIMGVPVEVSVEIGRTRKLVKDILELNKGSLVVLDKLAGEQVDLFVNGQCIAKGDVVVVDDNFGIRITQILSEDIPVA